MNNLVSVYQALAEYGKARAAQRAADLASAQTSAAGVRVLADSTPAAGARVDSRRVTRSRPNVNAGSASIA